MTSDTHGCVLQKALAKPFKNVGYRADAYKKNHPGFFITIAPEGHPTYSTAEDAAHAADDYMRELIDKGEKRNNKPNLKMNFPMLKNETKYAGGDMSVISTPLVKKWAAAVESHDCGTLLECLPMLRLMTNEAEVMEVLHTLRLDGLATRLLLIAINKRLIELKNDSTGLTTFVTSIISPVDASWGCACYWGSEFHCFVLGIPCNITLVLCAQSSACRTHGCVKTLLLHQILCTLCTVMQDHPHHGRQGHHVRLRDSAGLRQPI